MLFQYLQYEKSVYFPSALILQQANGKSGTLGLTLSHINDLLEVFSKDYTGQIELIDITRNGTKKKINSFDTETMKWEKQFKVMDLDEAGNAAAIINKASGTTLQNNGKFRIFSKVYINGEKAFQKHMPSFNLIELIGGIDSMQRFHVGLKGEEIIQYQTEDLDWFPVYIYNHEDKRWYFVISHDLPDVKTRVEII